MSLDIAQAERSPPWLLAGSLLLLGVAVVLLLITANHAWWQAHIEWDSVVYHERASHFLSRDTWGGMEYNEYQPGAMWFFVLAGKLTPTSPAMRRSCGR